MGSVRRVAVRSIPGALVALVLAGCAGGPTPSPQPVVTPSPTITVAPSPTVAARIYPYTLPWPEEQLRNSWRYASAPWDGEVRIDHGNRFTDSVVTRVGDLFAFGYETAGTAADLQALVAQQASEWHGCDVQPVEEAPLAGGGEDGILAVHECGDRQVLRWFAVHDGFGLMVALIVARDADPDVARAQFEDQVGELAWED